MTFVQEHFILNFLKIVYFMDEGVRGIRSYEKDEILRFKLVLKI